MTVPGVDPARVVGLDPTYRRNRSADPHGRAPRPASLAGLPIGLLSNTKGCASELLRALHTELVAIAAAGPAVLVAKPSFSVPPTPENWAELQAHAAVAVVALGA